MPNPKNQSPNGGAPQPQGVRDQIQNAGQQVQQGAEQVANRLRDSYDTAREGALHGYRQAEGAVARNPVPSLLIGLGVGFGLGLVLSSMFSSREETWAEKYLPESLQDAPDRYHRLVESLRSLPKTVHDHLPSAVAKHLG
jgi:ElaB/YqjD/DUF883 family membrane-anchored ribosome-binding protein